MFAGPFSRGPGRELGATMAASALSALGPNTVFFRTQTSSGVEEEIFVELDSESEWQTWVGAGMGARLYVMRDESDFKRVTIEQILSREDALRAAADAEATGTYLYLAGSTFEEDDKNLKNLERVRSSVAYGLEVETTRALAADESAEKEFGILTALNDARAVTFVQKGEPGNNHPARGGRALPQQQVGGAERGEGHPLFLRRQRPDKARPLAQGHPSFPGRLRDQASRSQAAA